MPWTDPDTGLTIDERYLTVDGFKKTLNLTGQSFADDDIAIAIEAASRGLEEAYSSFWTKGPDGDQRFYTASTGRIVSLGDVLKITAVGLDYSIYDVYTDTEGDDAFYGGGTYSISLGPTDYRLLPIPQLGGGLVADGGRGEPFRELHLARGAKYLNLPRGVDAIRITGTFGWETVPAGVMSACSILATRLLRRSREAPWGIVAIGLEGAVIRIREMTRDPEILFAMNALGGTRSLIV